MIDTGVIDKKVLDELLSSVGGDKDFLVELIETYLSDAAALLARLRSALVARDADEFRRSAHSLKSSSASLGALPLSALGKELETIGKAGDLDSAAEKLPAAEAEFARVRDELTTYRSTVGG